MTLKQLFLDYHRWPWSICSFELLYDVSTGRFKIIFECNKPDELKIWKEVELYKIRYKIN